MRNGTTVPRRNVVVGLVVVVGCLGEAVVCPVSRFSDTATSTRRSQGTTIEQPIKRILFKQFVVSERIELASSSKQV